MRLSLKDKKHDHKTTSETRIDPICGSLYYCIYFGRYHINQLWDIGPYTRATTRNESGESSRILATVPYHVLVMLIIWPIFAHLYFRKSPKRNPAQQKQETFRLGLLWLALAMIVDYVSFVLIKTPFSLTFYQFYVDYQPWISLIYLAIFLSPWIRLGVVGLGNAHITIVNDKGEDFK